MRARDEIAIEGLRVDCVVGVYPRERQGPQTLLVDVSLRLDTEEAGRAQALRASVDYARVAAQVTFLLENARFRMLETAAQALLRLLLLPPLPGERRAAVEEATVRLCKPDALSGNGRPALTVRRDREWLAESGVRRERPFGSVDVLAETRDAGLYRISVAPGHAVPLHAHSRSEEVEMVLGGGLVCQGRRAAPGTVFRWLAGAAHGYENPTAEPQALLRVDVPPLQADDEEEVAGAPADVRPERVGYRR